jgi:hypothetical protein
MKSTIVALNNGSVEAFAQLLEMERMLQDVPAKETEKTSIIECPSPKEAPTTPQTSELSLRKAIEALPVMPMAL